MKIWRSNLIWMKVFLAGSVVYCWSQDDICIAQWSSWTHFSSLISALLHRSKQLFNICSQKKEDTTRVGCRCPMYDSSGNLYWDGWKSWEVSNTLREPQSTQSTRDKIKQMNTWTVSTVAHAKCGSLRTTMGEERKQETMCHPLNCVHDVFEYANMLPMSRRIIYDVVEKSPDNLTRWISRKRFVSIGWWSLETFVTRHIPAWKKPSFLSQADVEKRINRAFVFIANAFPLCDLRDNNYDYCYNVSSAITYRTSLCSKGLATLSSKHW